MTRLHPDFWQPEFQDLPAMVGHFWTTHKLLEKGIDVFKLRESDPDIDLALKFCQAAFRLHSTRILIAGLDALRRAAEHYLNEQECE